MNIQKNTIAVAIGSQKGGVGKTTTTVMLASLLNYHTNLKVAVIDVDPQHSAIDMRNREVERYKKAVSQGDEAIKDEPVAKWMADLKAKGKGVFRIIPIYAHELKRKAEPIVRAELELKVREAEEAGIKLYRNPDEFEKAVAAQISRKADDLVVDTSNEIIKKGELDIVFFDFPGFIGDEKEAEENLYGRLLRKLNFVFVPLDVDPNTMGSSVDYLKLLLELKKKKTLNDFGGFMWKFSNAKNTQVFVDTKAALTKLGIRMMDNKVFESNEFKMNFSTIRPLDLSKDKSLLPFMEEFLIFCGILKKGEVN